jgi:transposase
MRRIRLTEGQLHNVIRESVNNILNEIDWKTYASAADKSERKPGGGKKARYSDRLYFSAIVYVLRTGIIWNALPRLQFENITSQAVHKKFLQWSRAGLFQRLWQAGLVEYDEMEGIAWEWQAADGSLGKAPLAQESVGSNPADRGKNGSKKKSLGRRTWHPVVNRRDRCQSTR